MSEFEDEIYSLQYEIRMLKDLWEKTFKSWNDQVRYKFGRCYWDEYLNDLNRLNIKLREFEEEMHRLEEED